MCRSASKVQQANGAYRQLEALRYYACTRKKHRMEVKRRSETSHGHSSILHVEDSGTHFIFVVGLLSNSSVYRDNGVRGRRSCLFRLVVQA